MGKIVVCFPPVNNNYIALYIKMGVLALAHTVAFFTSIFFSIPTHGCEASVGAGFSMGRALGNNRLSAPALKATMVEGDGSHEWCKDGYMCVQLADGQLEDAPELKEYIGESGRLLFLPSVDPRYMLNGELFTIDDNMQIVDDGKLLGLAYYNSEGKIVAMDILLKTDDIVFKGMVDIAV